MGKYFDFGTRLTREAKYLAETAAPSVNYLLNKSVKGAGAKIKLQGPTKGRQALLKDEWTRMFFDKNYKIKGIV